MRFDFPSDLLQSWLTKLFMYFTSTRTFTAHQQHSSATVTSTCRKANISQHHKEKPNQKQYFTALIRLTKCLRLNSCTLERRNEEGRREGQREEGIPCYVHKLTQLQELENIVNFTSLNMLLWNEQKVPELASFVICTCFIPKIKNCNSNCIENIQPIKILNIAFHFYNLT